MLRERGDTVQSTKTRQIIHLLIVVSVIIAALGIGVLPLGATETPQRADSAPALNQTANLTEDREDPTNCNGSAQEYTECEANGKSEYVVRVVSDVDPTAPGETANSTADSVAVLVYSVENDIEYLERIIRFRVSDYAPTVVEYFLDRGIRTVLANERTAENRDLFVNITERTVDRSVQYERDRANETVRTGPDRAAYSANYTIAKAKVVVSATEKTVPRLIDTSDETIRNSPNRTRRAADDGSQATLESIEQAVQEAPPFVESVEAWIEYRVETTPGRAAQIADDATNGTKTAENPTDEGPGCDNGGVIEYSRCEAEYKTFVALYLVENTDTDNPIETALLYVSTTTGNASDIQENDLHYYDDKTDDPLVTESVIVGKNISAPLREQVVDNNPDCSGEEAEYTRCEAEYKSHVILTSGINRTYPTDYTRTADELTPVVVELILDSYANDVPYYSRNLKDRSAPIRDIPQENGTCRKYEVRYTRCEAEYKTDFIAEDTLNRTYPGDLIRTASENLRPAVQFINDIYNNDVPYYDNNTYHPAAEGAVYITKNATYPSRETITANDPDCGGESIEYTRCRSEYKSSVVLEDGINRTYPTDITRTIEEYNPVLSELLQATIEDGVYYLQADPIESVNRSFFTVDNVTNSEPTGPIVRGRTREAKWRTSPVRGLPDDDPDCSGDIAAYTACEAQYKSHVVLNDIFENTFPADTHRTFYETSPVVLNLTNDAVENDVPYYQEKINNATSEATADRSVQIEEAANSSIPDSDTHVDDVSSEPTDEAGESKITEPVSNSSDTATVVEDDIDP